MTGTTAIIPARWASSRFPGKPLICLNGMTMIERVYRQASKATLVERVIVATDDERIEKAVKSFGGEAVMTAAAHPSGTDRLAEVVRGDSSIALVVNVQGDEPLIDPGAIDAAIEPLLADASVEMSTLAAPIRDEADAQAPSVVKVVTDVRGFALYFSRACIPHYRDQREFSRRNYLGHVGLYVYRRDCLLRLAGLSQTPLEESETLEQLRAIENGIGIRVVIRDYRSLAVDVPDDVARVEAALAAGTIH